MTVAELEPEALLFDLFGTLVFIDGKLIPDIVVAGKRRKTTIPDIQMQLGDLAPGVSVAAFFESLEEVSRRIATETESTHREQPSRMRFVRTLERLGVVGDVAQAAERLSLQHMAGLAGAVVCPSDRVSLLREISRHYPIALVSNFDHAPTARRILEDNGLLELFDAVVISDEVGIRKPAPGIFHHASQRLGVEPASCIHIGDSFRADIEGARAAGMAAVWVDAGDHHADAVDARIGDVRELPDLLPRR